MVNSIHKVVFVLFLFFGGARQLVVDDAFLRQYTNISFDKLFEEDIISFTAWSNQYCILSEEGEGGSQSTYSVFFLIIFGEST